MRGRPQTRRWPQTRWRLQTRQWLQTVIQMMGSGRGADLDQRREMG